VHGWEGCTLSSRGSGKGRGGEVEKTLGAETKKRRKVRGGLKQGFESGRTGVGDRGKAVEEGMGMRGGTKNEGKNPEEGGKRGLQGSECNCWEVRGNWGGKPNRKEDKSKENLGKIGRFKSRGCRDLLSRGLKEKERQ